MATRYGIRADYDDDTARTSALSVWSGAFMMVWEATSRTRHGSRRITLNTYNGDKVTVKLPEGVTMPRTEGNYEQIDAAISAALNAYEAVRGSQILA